MQVPHSTITGTANDSRVNLLGLERRAMEQFFVDLREPPFRAVQVLKWIHQHRVTDFAAMTNLSKQLRARLATLAEIRFPEVVSAQVAADGTRKWLLRVDAGNCIETVYIPDAPRATLCISSQVGCALNCTFCATAEQGFNRNLSAAEIIAQVWLAVGLLRTSPQPCPPLTNVVFMGMGEPLLNFDNVAAALDLLLEDNAYGFARRRVTVSTAGVVPRIAALKTRAPVSLAVSLHAPDDALRDELVPLNRTYPMDELLAACRAYVAGDAREKVTFEYVMLDGVNDSTAHARELARRLEGIPAKVNLIPLNAFASCRYRRSPVEVIDRFREVLMAGGIMTITRKTRGDDIDAACGQLAGRVQPRSRRVAARRAARAAAADATLGAG